MYMYILWVYFPARSCVCVCVRCFGLVTAKLCTLLLRTKETLDTVGDNKLAVNDITECFGWLLKYYTIVNVMWHPYVKCRKPGWETFTCTCMFSLWVALYGSTYTRSLCRTVIRMCACRNWQAWKPISYIRNLVVSLNLCCSVSVNTATPPGCVYIIRLVIFVGCSFSSFLWLIWQSQNFHP